MGTLTGINTSIPLATWSSNMSYIMWKDIVGGVPNSTDFVAAIQGNNLGYDKNYTTATYVSLLTSIMEVFVIIYAWKPFGDWYQHQNELLTRPPLYDLLDQ